MSETPPPEQEESSARKRLKAVITAPRRAITDAPVQVNDLLSCGSTLVNMVASGRAQGCFCKGRYFFFVGDSGSGKTFLALSAFAEAARNRNFDDYRFIYDNVEDGALMEIEKFFGTKVRDRLEPPKVDQLGGPVFSRTIEEFYYHLYDALNFTVKEKMNGKSVDRPKPCIYILDSMDGLDSKYAGKKFLEGKREHEGGAKAKGDYGDGKAKMNSQHNRKMIQLLRDTGSILIVICQSRDNIDGGMFEPEQTYSGGRAIKFYAGLEMWTSISKRVKKSINGHDRQIGIISRVAIKKNRMSGKEWDVKVPIYWSHGVDDVGSMVDFLTEEKHWKSNKEGVIKADEFQLCVGREELIQHIEKNDMERDLQMIVGEVFEDIIAKCQVERKSRYE